jgi:hypothetical protein
VKSVLAVFLITLQLALQVGVPIHKHFCEMDGVFTSVVLKIDHECKESAPKNDLPPCCQAAQTKSCEIQVVKDDCCSDELEVVKTTLDQSHQDGFNWNLSLDLVSIPSTPTYAYYLTNLAQKQIAKQTYYRPPPLFERGRDIRTLHQVWRI